MKRLSLLLISGLTLVGLTGAAHAQGWRGGGGGHGHGGGFAAPARGFRGAPVAAPARGFHGAPRPYFGHAAPVYARPLAPSRAHIWVPGYWGFHGGTRVWIGGAWALPPYAGWTWVGPQWTWNGYNWVWVEGHWAAPAY